MKDLESIDKYLVSEIDGLDTIPSDNVWNSIDSKLEANKAARNSRAKKIKVIGTAAVLTVTAALVITYSNMTEQKQSAAVATEQKTTAPAEKNTQAANETQTVATPVQTDKNELSAKDNASVNKSVSNNTRPQNEVRIKEEQDLSALNKKEEPVLKPQPVASVVNENKKDNSDKNIILLPYFAPGYNGTNTQANKATPPGPSVTAIKNDQAETPKTDPRENTVYMPNAFTPNGDGLNDVFLPQTAETPAEYKLSVFDRSGNLVFISEDIQKGWDGRTYRNGIEEVKEDVYIWRIEMKTIKGEKRHLMGSLTLLK